VKLHHDTKIDIMRLPTGNSEEPSIYPHETAKSRMILCGVAEDSDKDLIVRTIRDLCRHAEKLDLKDEHKEDLDYFKRVCLGREKGSSGSPGDGQMAGEAKAGDSGGKWGGAAKNCG